jgi:hypothetical protein
MTALSIVSLVKGDLPLAWLYFRLKGSPLKNPSTLPSSECFILAPFFFLSRSRRSLCSKWTILIIGKVLHRPQLVTPSRPLLFRSIRPFSNPRRSFWIFPNLKRKVMFYLLSLREAHDSTEHDIEKQWNQTIGVFAQVVLLKNFFFCFKRRSGERTNLCA